MEIDPSSYEYNKKRRPISEEIQVHLACIQNNKCRAQQRSVIINIMNEWPTTDTILYDNIKPMITYQAKIIVESSTTTLYNITYMCKQSMNVAGLVFWEVQIHENKILFETNTPRISMDSIVHCVTKNFCIVHRRDIRYNAQYAYRNIQSTCCN